MKPHWENRPGAVSLHYSSSPTELENKQVQLWGRWTSQSHFSESTPLLLTRERAYTRCTSMLRLFSLLALALPSFAQQLDLDSYLKVLDSAPGSSIENKIKALDGRGITLSIRGLQELNSRTSKPATPSYQVPKPMTPIQSPPQLRSADGQANNLGTVSANPFDPNSISNPYGQYGSPYSPNSVNNPFGQYGSPYSPTSATNPYTTQAPAIVAPDGTYLGKFSTNKFDPDSVSNPYGQYGSPYSPSRSTIPMGSMEVPIRLRA